ncbi:MAG: sugar transferase [Anaerolineales bacterium]
MLRGTLGAVGVLAVLLSIWWVVNEFVRSTASRSWMNLFLFIIYAIFAVLVERGLSMTPVRRDWRYRLSFLIPLLQFSILWLLARTQMAEQVLIIWLLAAGAGAFSGGLLATSLREGMWEDNSPPSQRIQKEVHQRHLKIIGVPGKTPLAKRLFDALLSVAGLVVSIPLWLVMVVLLWLEDPGPLLFVKNSVGKGGINFHQYKFRTMVMGAESVSGPVPASRSDERVLVVGSLLRKTALDELPQIINILKGEMSFVGPRPQRTVLVHGYLEKIPEYAERHRVLPGLSGLAQVAGDYYLTPRQKLRFDRLYIRHASLGFDLQLLVLAFLITFWYRWQPDWDGRLPRQLLRWGG